MEMHRDLERQRTEADLKRAQMVLNNQPEIATLVARSRKRKSRSTPSSSESECQYASSKTYLKVMLEVVKISSLITQCLQNNSHSSTVGSFY